MGLFRTKWHKPSKKEAAIDAEAGLPARQLFPNCYINPRTGNFVHRKPHSCAPQARSSFKPVKKRKEYRKRQRKMSRVRTSKR